MQTVYVAGNREQVGKTALCAALARKLGDQGRSVGVVKPLAGGSGGAEDPDPAAYQAVLGIDAGPAARVPDGGLDDGLVAQVRAAVEKASAGLDVLLVEGSSRLSPAETGTLVDALDALAVLVIGYEPGLTPGGLAPWKDALGERLACSVVNGVTTYQGAVARGEFAPALTQAGFRPAGLLPEDRRLLGVRVDEIARHLNGEYVGQGYDTDALVEHVLVGCQTLDPGELYFGLHQDKAVVVRGDRPDIQMSALGTPTACMVITKNMYPIEYVIYEAGEEEVPLIMVRSDTLDTMAALDTLQNQAQFNHPAKLDRLSALLDKHADLPAIYAAIGVPE